MAGVKSFVAGCFSGLPPTHAEVVAAAAAQLISQSSNCSAGTHTIIHSMGFFIAHPAYPSSRKLSCCRVGLRPELSAVDSGRECAH